MANKVAVVERFKQESMQELFTKKVAVAKVADVERLPLVELRLYYAPIKVKPAGGGEAGHGVGI